MASTPRRSSRRRNPNPETPPSQKQRPDGFFRDGEWWCNCNPRQRAGHHQVRKDSPTKGQWFYTCRCRPQCNFFLWEDQAKIRETGLVSPDEEHEELPPRPKTPSFTQRPLTSYGVQVTPGRRLSDLTADDSDEEEGGVRMETPCPPSKRKRDAFEDDFVDMDSDEERQMLAMAERSAKGKASQATPQDAFTTPTNPRSVDATNGLPTPSVTRTLFQDGESRNSKRQKNVSFEEPPSTSTTSSKTLTPGTAEPSTPSSSPSTESYDATDEVMALLRPHKLDASVLSAVRGVLATSARRAKGIAMGRDSARVAAREKDSKIAKLQERVAALENKDRVNHNQITNMKAGIMRLYQDN